jgi:electron transfer flavoprotein beta subunit
MSASRPLIATCLRVTDLRPEVDPLSGVVTHDLLAVGLSLSDEAALEHALRLAEAWSAAVVAIAVGPPSIDPVLREVAALGVETVRVPEPDHRSPRESPVASSNELAGDEQALARAVAAALSGERAPDLVLCGDRSPDRGTGAFPSFLAHELAAAQALGLVSLAPEPGSHRLVAERRLDAGWREQLSIPLPAVCSVEGAGVRLRRATLTGALATAETPVPTDPGAAAVLRGARERTGVLRLGATRVFEPRTRVVAAPPEDDPRLRVLSLTGATATHDPPVVVGPVDAPEAADVLLDYLGRHGYLEGRLAEGTATREGVEPR